MKILLSGSTGFVGKSLLPALAKENNEVIRLVRANPNSKDVIWDPLNGKLEVEALKGIEAVIHLAGENIAGRWTTEKKERIRNSRIKGTHFLAETATKLSSKPKIFIGASAVGFYGDRGDEILTEKSSPGKSFLPQVCQEWEEASKPASQAGIRTALLRIGMVLDKEGGALSKMMIPFKLGLSGIIGSGKQWMSWITLEDVVGAILHVLKDNNLSGPINVVAPNPIINFGFTKTLGKAIHRPTIFPMPAFVARLAMGEMADELLLASTRVQPEKLIQSGFAFKHPSLESALKAVGARHASPVELHQYI